VYPALAVLQALTGKVEVLWVGAEGGMESTLVQRAGIRFETIPAAGLHGVGIKRMPRNLTQLVKGISASKRILNRFQPDVILFTGGFIAFPMAVAARKLPSLLFVPDIEPGLAIKTIARFVNIITVSAPESLEYFWKKAKVVVTGYPTRPELGKWDRKSASQYFKLDEKKPILLVFGGSKGAHSINSAILDQLPELLQLAQIIHISGELDWPSIKDRTKALTSIQMKHYHAFPYLHEEMGAALASADLVVSRSGASSLGEFPLFSLPAILIPYPHAWRYQSVNAEYLANQGAAILLKDSEIGSQLIPSIKELLENPTRLESMRSSMHRLSHPHAAMQIGQQLFLLAGERS
jgi:UDP-N-acetylglucosamine--N-acetylmuramyl-(pentapeptide) pyrophosphoryl-undecaprenol N-acetylglucosamine transferase